MTTANGTVEATGQDTAVLKERRPIDVGRDLVSSIVNRRFDDVERLAHPEIRLRSMNASGPVERHGASEVATFYHGEFADATSFELVSTSTREMADRIQISWHFNVERPDGDGPETVEQHLFVKVVGGAILRIDQVCSGFRPRSR